MSYTIPMTSSQKWGAAILGIILFLAFVTTVIYLFPNKSKGLVEKDQWTVEDAHGAGEFMIVRRGNDRLRLHCDKVVILDDYDDGSQKWNTYGSDSCYPFAPGESIQLEKWDSKTYVYKCRKTTGEFQYKVIDE
jgi:hypothetical protein